jgi:hypothetical protein
MPELTVVQLSLDHFDFERLVHEYVSLHAAPLPAIVRDLIGGQARKKLVRCTVEPIDLKDSAHKTDKFQGYP